jgi:hypothetical protein
MSKKNKTQKTEVVTEAVAEAPKCLMLFEAVLKFGMEGAKTKKGVAENVVAYYKAEGVEDTSGLKKAFKGKVDKMDVEYINKFIDTVTVDFNKPTGWRNIYEVVSDKEGWRIQEKVVEGQ